MEKNCLSSWQELKGCGMSARLWGGERLLILEDVDKVKVFCFFVVVLYTYSKIPFLLLSIQLLEF